MATGHIRKRVSDTGEVSYQIVVESERDPVSGKRNRQYKTIRGTKKLAEAHMKKMIQEIESGGLALPSAMTVGDWVNTWLRDFCPNIEATTRAGYQEKIDNYIAPSLGNIPLKDLRAEDIQRWVNDLRKKGLSSKTIHNTFNVLNPALKKAVTTHKIPYNPGAGVERPKLVRPKVKAYEKDCCQQVLEAAQGTDMYLIVLLEIMTGLRRGELIALKWPQVDLDAGVIHICENTVRVKSGTITKQPKSQAGNRSITIGSEVVKALHQAKKAYEKDRKDYGNGFHDEGYVIRQENGEPYQPDTITHKWKRFLKKHNLPHLKFHGLRHTHATMGMDAGVSPKVMQQRLGHADVTLTLNTYTHVTRTADQDAARKLEDMILTPPGAG